MVGVDEHPLLELAVVCVDLDRPLASYETPARALALFEDLAHAPAAEEPTKGAIRRMLRRGGFKPAGRSKPASEYLVAARSKGRLGPINCAVDLCNAASLHTGVPISVVDRHRLEGAGRVAVASAGASYVFNHAGQVIDCTGLLSLADDRGPCANAVKDSQRTKTHEAFTSLLYLCWGSTELTGVAAQAAGWCADVWTQLGARVDRGPW